MLCRCLLSATALLLVATGADTAKPAEAIPHWLWTSKDAKESETVYFRKTIELKGAPKAATFYGSCDNVMTLFVNGEMVTQHSAWETPTRENLTKRLKAGK